MKLFSIFKTIVSFTFTLCICICFGISTYAADSGTFKNGRDYEFTWETDLEAGTLTITGEEYAYWHPKNGEIPWLDDADKLHTLILKGRKIYISSQQYNYEEDYAFAETIIGDAGDGFTWTLERSTGITTLNGKGVWPNEVKFAYIHDLVIGEGITYLRSPSNGEFVGELISDDYDDYKVTVSSTAQIGYPIQAEYIVAEGNPCHASYDGCLYTADYERLLATPEIKVHPKFHPDLKIIGTGSFGSMTAFSDPLVIPWGVTTIEDNAFLQTTWGRGDNRRPVFILPDTTTSINITSSRDSTWKFIYSIDNTEAFSKLKTTAPADHGGHIEVTVLPTVAEYYPDTYEEIDSLRPDSGWYRKNGKTYYIGEDGGYITGWKKINDIWYYFNTDGSMAVDQWAYSWGKWYWLNADGSMAMNQWVDWCGKRYRIGGSGAMYTSMWVWDIDCWRYLGEDGAAVVCCWIGNEQWNEWYWLGIDGKMSSNEWLDLDGIRYRTSRSGVRYFNCWAQIDGKWYWFNNDGSMTTSRWIYGKDRKWYYVGSDGVMLTNTLTPDGYYVDANGVWVQ